MIRVLPPHRRPDRMTWIPVGLLSQDSVTVYPDGQVEVSPGLASISDDDLTDILDRWITPHG